MNEATRQPRIGFTGILLWIAWATIVAVVAVALAGAFATDIPCRVGEEADVCKGRRTADGLGLLGVPALVAVWAIVAFIVPLFARRWWFRHR